MAKLELKQHNASTDAEQVKTEVEAEATVAPQNGVVYGADSDKITLVAPLGNPADPDTTSVKNADGTISKNVTSTIVGYRFVSAIDLDVPDVEPTDDLKKNLMSFNPEKVGTTRHVPAGTEFDLTKFETGMLLSEERFNGRISGGGKEIVCSYNTQTKKGSNGALQTTGAASAIPVISLRPVKEGTSIKDMKCIDVLSVQETVGENGQKRKIKTINPGFEKFAPLAKDAVRISGAGTRTNAPKAPERNKGAEAFLKIASMQARKA